VTDRPHFSVAGIPVRIEPLFFVISALFGLRYAEQSVSLVVVWIAVTFVSILVHELGHGLALKAFGSPSTIVLHGLGGVTLSNRALSRSRSVIVSLAGSVTALLVLWLPARFLDGSDWWLEQDLWVRGAVTFTAFANLWWSVANLLPIRPLDGGNVVSELFGVPAARRVTVVAGAGGGAVALAAGQPYAGLFAFFLAYASYQEIQGERGPRPPHGPGAPPEGPVLPPPQRDRRLPPAS
jgi:stage IV sporulation protein FB